MAGRSDGPGLHLLQNTAARLVQMPAVIKPARAEAGTKFRKQSCQIFFFYAVNHPDVKGCKTWCISSKSIVIQRIQLYMPGSMFSTAQPGADGIRFYIQLRHQPVEKAGFAHAGLPCENRYLPLQQFSDFLYAFSVFSAGQDKRKTCFPINVIKTVCPVKVTFVDAQRKGAIRILCYD